MVKKDMKYYRTTIISMVAGIFCLAFIPLVLMIFIDMQLLHLIIIELPILIAPLLIGAEQLHIVQKKKHHDEHREISIAIMMWFLLVFVTVLFIYSRAIAIGA